MLNNKRMNNHACAVTDSIAIIITKFISDNWYNIKTHVHTPGNKYIHVKTKSVFY